MPTWTLRLLVATNLASLGMSGVVAYAVLHQRPTWVAPRPPPPDPSGGTASPASDPGGAPSAGPGYAPFVREYQYVDKASGQLRGAVLVDDAGRLEQFVHAGHLSAEQESHLRAAFAARRDQEMQLARRMVNDGAWDHGALRAVGDRFWAQAFHDLPPAQAASLPPEFFPAPAK